MRVGGGSGVATIIRFSIHLSIHLSTHPRIHTPARDQIADGFVFWQAQHTVPEARSFLDRYHHTEASLPLLAVLDPRTQREMWSHGGTAIDKGELAAKRT